MSSRKRSSAKDKNPVQSQASKKKKKASGSDPFYNGLKKAGFVVGLENEPNELEVDQDKFLRVLEKNLPSKESVETFVSGLEKLLEDDIRFKWCLLPTVTSSSCKNARNERQDSFLHLLLNVESLQENVGKLLLQKLADFSFADSSDIFDPTEGRSLSCMILSQFRSLSRLVNSSEIAEKLLEFVRITPVEVQKDIISLLPEILHVSDHDSAARVLAEVLVESSGLTVTVLTALSNLAVDEDTLATAREQVLKTLSVAKIEDLPGIARFVLTDLRTDDMKETIREVRQRLEIAPEFDPEWSSTPISIAGHNTGEKCNSVLLIDSIKLTIQFQKQVCDSWIQVLDSVGSSEPFRAFDIIMIFVLHSISLYQKKVENMVKRKVRNGELSEKLLSETFKHNSVVLRDYLSSILSLSEAMLKLPEAVVSSFGSSMYVKSFECFKTNSKQNVVGNLVTHAGSGLVHERDAAINTLLSLVRVHTSVMGHFGIFIKNLLDYFDSFTLMQVRKVYEMLSYLTYQGGREGHMMEDDMQMIIRKQLKNNDIKYAKIGVIGALVTVKTVCCKPEVSVSSQVLDSDELMEKAQQHAVPLLELAYQSVL